METNKYIHVEVNDNEPYLMNGIPKDADGVSALVMRDIHGDIIYLYFNETARKLAINLLTMNEEAYSDGIVR